MRQKEIVDVPKGNGPIPPNTYVLPGTTAEDFRRVWRKMDSKSQKKTRR